MGAAVPEEAIIHDSGVVGGALPFAHQHGPGARKRGSRRNRRALGSIAPECLIVPKVVQKYTNGDE